MSTLAGAAGTAPAVTRLLREKIAAKFAAGGAATRRAFASLDEDGDGALNLAEFRKCLSNFLIAPPEETTLALYAAHADTTLGGISCATFASAFFPPPAVDPAMDPAAAAAIREEAHRARDTAAARLASAAAEAEARGGAMTFAEARDALGPNPDVALVRALLDASRADLDGRVTATAAAAAVATLRAKDADIAVRRAQRGFVDGFGRDLAERSLRSVGPVTAPAALSPEALESILRETLASRGPGGGARARARRSFARLDARRRGWIGKEEFGDALRKCHVPVTPGDVDALVARFDASGTGRVSLADFVQRIAPADFPDATDQNVERRRVSSTGFDALGKNSYEPPRAPTPPPFPRRLHVAAIVALATEKMLQRTPRGWSEAKQLARAFDPAGSGTVSRASFRDALARVGLASVSDADVDAAFARLAGDAFASTDEVPTAAFVRRALPPSYAERPARADVLRELRDAGAADERDVRAVLSSCGVEMDEAAVARLLRACEGEAGEGPDMVRVAAAVSAPEPRARRPVTPTPAVDHCESETWDARPREKTPPKKSTTRADDVESDGSGRETNRSARRHPHESRVNEGTTTRRFVPPPRVSSSFDDFHASTSPFRRAVGVFRRARSPPENRRRASPEPRVHEILRIFVVREEIPARRARLRVRLVARVFVLVREERRAAGKVPRARRRFDTSARVVARLPFALRLGEMTSSSSSMMLSTGARSRIAHRRRIGPSRERLRRTVRLRGRVGLRGRVRPSRSFVLVARSLARAFLRPPSLLLRRSFLVAQHAQCLAVLHRARAASILDATT